MCLLWLLTLAKSNTLSYFLQNILTRFFLELQGMRIPSYDDELLRLAEDLARRMLPAFDTPTGMELSFGDSRYQLGRINLVKNVV